MRDREAGRQADTLGAVSPYSNNFDFKTIHQGFMNKQNQKSFLKSTATKSGKI
jgi:hypothetical protein